MPVNDTVALADALYLLLNDEQRMRKIGRAGWDQAKKLFDSQKNIQTTFAVYQEILNKGFFMK